ncbi:hypothetical protein UFOVP89_26 [uncultured Caudovirales phage]|uniref:Uncharacterized protein n=1 Tax=uncultured Caudovirales phage TaxID=2100421 RepID=A0A6J5KWD4_9CAUD|nr:hypothetical protein UFOVP89_26 [uncultured Caudovirales phage]
MERLLSILDDWKLYMKSSSHRLGYPSKSLGMSSGGESTEDEFEHMVNAMDKANVRTLDAIIHSLDKGQQQALYAKYLGAKPPLAYSWQLDMAMDNLMTIASRRINA